MIETPTTHIPQMQPPADVSPDILHLVHPLLFANLNKMVGNILKLQKQLDTAPASTTNARLAQTTFVQLLDTAGVKFDHMESLMKQLEQAVDNADGECDPIPRLEHYLMPKQSIHCVVHSYRAPCYRSCILQRSAQLKSSTTLMRLTD
jgi:hypothetical protein